jgi:hypothetical protein
MVSAWWSTDKYSTDDLSSKIACYVKEKTDIFCFKSRIAELLSAKGSSDMFSTVNLPSKIACFVKDKNNIFCVKSS